MLIGRRTVTPLTNPRIRAMMNEVHSQGMTTAQRMEKQFFIKMIALVNEIQSDKTILKSQSGSYRKSAWCKTIKTPKQDQSALASV